VRGHQLAWDFWHRRTVVWAAMGSTSFKEDAHCVGAAVLGSPRGGVSPILLCTCTRIHTHMKTSCGRGVLA